MGVSFRAHRMLSPRWRKVLRDIWLHKARTILVVLAISVGIAGAGAVLTAWSLLRTVTRDEFGVSNPASATLVTDSIDAVLLAQVRAIPSVKSAEARRVVIGSVSTQEGVKTAMLIASPDFSGSLIGIIKQDGGAWPPADNDLVVESSSVDFSGAVIGDQFTVQVGDASARELRISGIARDVGLAPGWMEHLVYLFVTPATLSSLGAPSSFNQLQLVVRDRSMSREQVREVAGEVQKVIERTGGKVHTVDVPEPGRHIHAGQINSLLFTQGAFGMLALLLSGFIVVNLVAAMLTGQVREIGVMKALGAQTGQIATMYLVLALVLGLIACAVAIPVAAVTGRLYAEFTADTLNFDIAGARIPVWVIAIQFAVGMTLPVVAAAIPVVRGCGISVGDALRDFGIGGRGGRGDGVASGSSTGFVARRMSGINRPMLLSLRNAFRKKQRMLLTLLTLVAGGAVYLGAVNLRASIIRSVDTLFGTQRFDLVLRFARPHSADSIEAIARAVSGVDGVEAWGGARASMTRADGMAGGSFAITAPPSGTQMLSVPLISGRWLLAGDRKAIVVNRAFTVDEAGIEVGGTLALTIAGRLSQWEIVGIAEAGPSPAAYVTRESLALMAGGGGANAIVVRASSRGASSHLDLVQRLRSAFADAGMEVRSSQLMIEQRRVVEDHLLMVAGFLGIMAKLIIVIGGLGLASTMSLAVLERTREIGVMRAIGAGHGSILAIVQVEGLVIAVLSWVIAIPLSIPISVVLGRAFGRIMFKVPVVLVPEVSGVIAWLGVVVGVSIVACAWPAYRAMRVPTAAALAFE